MGLLATDVTTDGARGLFYAFYALAKPIDRLMGFRVSVEDETTGVDFTRHAETRIRGGTTRIPTVAASGHVRRPGRAPAPRSEKAQVG